MSDKDRVQHDVDIMTEKEFKSLNKKEKKKIWVGTHATTNREEHHDCCQQHFYGSTKNKVIKQLLEYFEQMDYFEHYDYMSVKSQLNDKGHFWFFDGEYCVDIEKVAYN